MVCPRLKRMWVPAAGTFPKQVLSARHARSLGYATTQLQQTRGVEGAAGLRMAARLLAIRAGAAVCPGGGMGLLANPPEGVPRNVSQHFQKLPGVRCPGWGS